MDTPPPGHHAANCPRVHDDEATCACGFFPPSMRELSLADAVRLFPVSEIIEMIDRLELIPMTTRAAFWVAASVALPEEKS